METKPILRITKTMLDRHHDYYLGRPGGRRLTVTSGHRIVLGRGVKLAGATLGCAEFRGCDFSNLDLSKVNFRAAFLIKCDFSGANLGGANLMGAELDRCKFSEANLTRAILDGARGEVVDFSEADMGHATLIGARFRESSFWKANLASSILVSGNFQESNFSLATLTFAILSGGLFRYCNFSGARMEHASGERGSFHRSHFCEAKLEGADFALADMQMVDFTEATLERAVFSNADLEWANFAGANLSMAEVSGASLRACRFYGANLSGIHARYSPMVENAKLDGGAGGTQELMDLARILPEGELIVYKALQDKRIATLRIPAGVERVSVGARKCRAAAAEVISIEDIDGHPHSQGVSSYDASFIYHVGERVYSRVFDKSPTVLCGDGLHFFLTRSEAVAYTKKI
ncbi:MAG: pentapeptide repeat-containing protein [Sphaerochaeta sp.]|nr:pentapeptide repeat-containing protein [Sphaerochaeta sp.]